MHLTQLLLQIAAILLLGRVLGRLFRRLGQPTVMAEIVAGIALGPSVLGLSWPGGMDLLFPKDSLPLLGMVAQLGLVFFMFLVGLEFDPKLLQGQARTSIAISNAGIIAPFSLGAALAFPLHATLAPAGVAMLPFSLFMGTAMSVTAFPVLARILTERGLIRTRVGAIALAAAAVDDVSAWCLLALVVGVASAGGFGAAAVTTALAVAYSAFVWFVVRPALARVGPRQGHAISADVVASVFLLVVLSAAVTEWIGIHALFGAFLIGAAMPRGGGLTAVLAEKMEDFVTVALLPLFFAYSGLRTQIGLVSTPTDWGLCVVIVAVATLGKFGGTALVGRLRGLPAREAAVLGVLMNTRGLMELIVLNVGLDLGVLSPRLFAMMVIMALVTTWATAPILARIYPPSRVPSDLPPARAVEPAAAESVLVCVSDPATARSLARLARAWAAPDSGSAWALHLAPTDRPRDYLRDGSSDTAAEPMEALASAARDVGLPIQSLAFPSADPASDIVRVAVLKQAKLILVGVHRTTFGADSLGGVTGRVLEDAESEVGVLLDRGIGELRSVYLAEAPGPHADAARRMVERLVASGVERRSSAAGGVDLVVTPWAPGGPVAGGGSSVLLVRGVR